MRWVIAQFLLSAAVAFARGGPPLPGGLLLKYPGVLLMLAGGFIVIAAVSRLARAGALTPLPLPRPGARLVAGGVYRFARHPAYTGVLAAALGMALFSGGWLNLCAWALLAALFGRKAALEERFLKARHRAYGRYCRVTGRFLPRLRLFPRSFEGAGVAAFAVACALVPLAHAYAVHSVTNGLCGQADAGLAAGEQMPVFLAPWAFDGYLWNRFAAGLGDNGEWRLRWTNLDNTPDGREVHWCTAYAWGLRALGELWRSVTGDTLIRSIFHSSVWAGPVFLAAAIIATASYLRARFGAFAAFAGGAGMLLINPFYESFSPAAPDHHGAVAFCVSGIFLGLAAGGAGWTGPGWPLPANKSAARRGMIFSAFCGAAGLWFSAFSTIPFLIAAGAGGLAAALAGRGAEGRGLVFHPSLWSVWGRWGCAFAAGFYLAEKFPDKLGLRLEVNHPIYALAWLGAGELLAAASARASGTPSKILINLRLVAALFALGSPLLVIFLLREVVFSPLDPFLGAIHREIAEFRPLTERIQSGFATWSSTLGLLPLLPGAAIALLLIRRVPPGLRLTMAALIPAGIAGFALPFIQIRWMSALGAVCVALSTFLLSFLWKSASTSSARTLAGFIFTLFYGVSGAGVWSGYPAFNITQFLRGKAVTPSSFQKLLLAHRELARRIAASSLPPGKPVVLAGPSSAVILTGLGGFRSLGTFYWENREGLVKSARLLTSSNRRAIHRELSALGVTHVALSGWENFMEEFQRVLRVAAPDGFRPERRPPLWRHVLETGEPPPGLELMPFASHQTEKLEGVRFVLLRLSATDSSAGNERKTNL